MNTTYKAIALVGYVIFPINWYQKNLKEEKAERGIISDHVKAVGIKPIRPHWFSSD